MTDHQQAAIEAGARALFVMQHRVSANVFDKGDYKALKDAAIRESTNVLAAAEPHLRKKWAEELVERIGASNLGAPLRIDPDGTFRMANGPEMRALLCEFILEAARRAR